MDERYPTPDDLDDAGHLEDYFDNAKELERLERIQRCEADTYEFALEYFSEARNPGNAGNWEGFDIDKKENAPEFHLEMTDIIDHVSNVEKNAKVAVAAPRSHAKSTWYTKDFPIHQVVYRLRKYIIIISETPAVASANMEWIRGQLKYNKKLRDDFGELLSPQDQSNIKDNSEEFIAWSNDGGIRNQLTLVQAASTGQALRGRNWNGSRPDLIICDDLEDARPGGNASTPEQREKLRDWFSQTVMALGDPKGERTAFVVVGTTVHFESLLMTILYGRSDFKSKVYRAIINEPLRLDLWEECRQLYIDRDDPDRLETANRFYETNEDRLLEGSLVLWGDVQPLYKLMRWKWDNGSKAFNTEYMNNPIDEDSMIFNPNEFTYWDDVNPNKEFNSDEYMFSMGVDFAMGKSERGDYSAIVTVAKHKENGSIFVIDAYGDKIKPDEFIKVIVDKTLEYQPDVIAVESVAAQEFFADTLKIELANEGYPAYTRLKKIFSRNRKEFRIEALLPLIENKTLQFSRRHSLLLEQFERFGQGGHDDLPDAAEMSINAAQEGESIVRTVRRMNRWY